jgi:uroporphyrinogen-III decarboxylase
MDGNEIPPDSPVENINAMFKAAEKYGKYCDKRGLEFWE